MAIDEIDGEPCDNTNTFIESSVAPNGNQVDKAAESIKKNVQNTTNNVNYIDDDDDDDIIILESDSPSSAILIVDDDNIQEEVYNVGKFKNANEKTQRKISFTERCSSNNVRHGILEEDFDSFCTTVTPSIRQYGRKKKDSTAEKNKNTLPSSSCSKAYIQSKDICELNINNIYLPGHQILKEQENGLKTLSEISAIFSSTSSIRSNELKEVDVTPVTDNLRTSFGISVHSVSSKIVMNCGDFIVQSEPETRQQIENATADGCDKIDQISSNEPNSLSENSGCTFFCTYKKNDRKPGITDLPAKRILCETSRLHLNSECATNFSVENTQQVQSSRKKAFVNEGRQLEQDLEGSDDIKVHLNKIFERNLVNNKGTQPSPVVVKMQDTPIIISENGVVTVIYKPDKVKLRRKVEISEPVNHRNEKPQRKAFKRKQKCSPDRKQETLKRVQSKKEFLNDLPKINKEALRNERPQRKTSKRNQTYSPDRKQEKQKRVQSTKENSNFLNDLTKTDKGALRLGSIPKQQISGIRLTKKKFPTIRKVKFRGELVYKCKDCDFVHPDSVVALRRHMIRHQPADSIEWFFCDLCEYKAKRKGNLKIHMILHRNPNEVVWYKCEKCDKKFKHKNGLYCHEKRHTQREELELYLCNQCSYKTPFKHTLLRHQIIHESTAQKTLLLCNMCSYSTYNKYYLSRHGQTHGEPTYKCLLCHYEAKFKINLESHMKRHYPDEEIFYCDTCDFSTKRRYTLTLHNRNVHNFYSNQENQMFSCYNCSYQTRFKRCLVKHMSIHCGSPGKETLVRIKTEVMTE